MLSKLVVVALSLAVANSAYTGPLAGGQPATQFPAGVDPKACPNYPVCENPSVAVNQVPVSAYSQYQPAQLQAQYSQPQYAQPQYVQPQQYSPISALQAQYQIGQSRYTSALGQPAPVQLQQRQYNLAGPQFSPSQAYNVPQQQYSAQQAQYPSHVQAALNRGEYIGDGDYHGEGLAESGAQEAAAPAAYNPVAYQQAYQAQIPQQAYQAQLSQPAYQAQIPQQAYQAASQAIPYHGAPQPAQLPAGLAPGACPNYPFCQQ